MNFLRFTPVFALAMGCSSARVPAGLPPPEYEQPEAAVESTSGANAPAPDREVPDNAAPDTSPEPGGAAAGASGTAAE